jgi:hypothetical protein
LRTTTFQYRTAQSILPQTSAAGAVDDVDFDAAIADTSDLGEDADAAFAPTLVRFHDAFGVLFVGAQVEYGIHQRRLAVVLKVSFGKRFAREHPTRTDLSL